MPEKPDSVLRTLVVGGFVAVLVLGGLEVSWAMKNRDQLDALKASVAALDARLELLDKVEGSVSELRMNQEFLVDDIARMQKKVDDLIATLENRDIPELGEEDEPPAIDWTDPQLFETAKKSAAEYGIVLTKDEVRVPARFVIRQGAIEYFAVLKGGKEHETLISLIGNTADGERRPKDFGARLNNAVQALGFKRGKRVRYTQSGRVPPEGETAYLLIEWEEKGEKVLVRAEDLVWNRMEERPMERGKWIYVGSSFVRPQDGSGQVFAADLTAEAVATYSSPDTIFDNVAQGDADDTAYLATTPRIPEGVEACTLIIRRTDIEATRTFPKTTASEDGK